MAIPTQDPRQLSLLDSAKMSPTESPPSESIISAETKTPAQTTTPSWAPQTELQYQSPEKIYDALLLAAELNHTLLVDALLSLPMAWDLKAFEDGTRQQSGLYREDKDKTALHLLLRNRNTNQHWQERGFETDHRQAELQALELVRRGSSFLALDAQEQSCLAIAASHKREVFFQGISTHPDFTYQNLKDLRVGVKSHHAKPTDQDNRDSLLGYLIKTGLHASVRLMLKEAQWPINERDLNGRYPISYVKDAFTAKVLLDMGADPALEDAHGKNATHYVQSIDTTAERDKIIGMVATILRKRATKDNPELLDQLRRDNIPALLETAKSATKSSLVKMMSAYKHDAATVCDPKTGKTPLMVCLQEGKLSAAQYLLDHGSSLNQQDQSGLSTAAYFLLNKAQGGSNRNLQVSFTKTHAPDINWNLTNKEGLPTAFHLFHLPFAVDSNTLLTGLKNIMSLYQKDSKLPIKGPNGESLVASFAQSMDRVTNHGYNYFDNLSKGFDSARILEEWSAADDLLSTGIQKLTQENQSHYYRSNARIFFETFQKFMSTHKISNDILIKSVQRFESLSAAQREAISKEQPTIYVLLEQQALQQMGLKASPTKSKATRL